MRVIPGRGLYNVSYAGPRGGREEVDAMSEVWQFVGVLGVFVIVALLWLNIIYLPGRTLERWEDRRPGRGEGRD